MDRAKAEAAKFAAFDRLKRQGVTTEFPGSYETISRDVGGFRSWLADHDLYFKGTNSFTFASDINGGKSPKDPQMFIGQKPTVINSVNGVFSWKIGGSGNDITQINFGGLYTSVNWVQAGPTGGKISDLSLFSSFFDRKVEIEIGYFSNLFEYAGIFSGGNPILANGLSGTIPIETGLSGSNTITPAFNIRFNGKNGLYSKSGVQRSVGPDGSVEEALNNGISLKFSRPGAKALFVQEFGLRRPASADGRQIWLRAGGSYNLTDYKRFDGSGVARNWSAYILADYQIVQPSKAEPYKGVYAGFSAMAAPDAVNIFTRSYEARVYAIGMVPGRPTDEMTVTVDYNRFSRNAQRSFASLGEQTNSDQFSVGALYAYHATHGIFISPSIAYIHHPSITGNFKPAVNLTGSVALLF